MDMQARRKETGLYRSQWIILFSITTHVCYNMELHFSLSDHTLWSWDPGMCSESSIMSSSTYTLSRDDSRVLLLSAFISKGNVFSCYNVILKLCFCPIVQM